MEYLLFVLAVAASIYVWTYGLWLKQQGNIAGAWLTFSLAILCISMPLYRMFGSK